MSLPLRFVIHAVSSSAAVTKTEAPASFIFFRRSLSLSFVLRPVYFSGTAHTGSPLTGGRSFQISSTGSRSGSTVPPFPMTARARRLPRRAPTSRPEKPSFMRSEAVFSTNSSKSGTPGSPSFISSTPLPLSSRSPWMKYLPSVQRYAFSGRTSRMLESPVNPDRKRTHSSWAPIYSLPWASRHMLIHAVIPCRSIASRRSVSCSLMFSPVPQTCAVCVLVFSDQPEMSAGIPDSVLADGVRHIIRGFLQFFPAVSHGDAQGALL